MTTTIIAGVIAVLICSIQVMKAMPVIWVAFLWRCIRNFALSGLRRPDPVLSLCAYKKDIFVSKGLPRELRVENKTFLNNNQEVYRTLVRGALHCCWNIQKAKGSGKGEGSVKTSPENQPQATTGFTSACRSSVRISRSINTNVLNTSNTPSSTPKTVIVPQKYAEE